MNPGIGVPEMIVVLVIALVVVGPEQLPVLMRKIGRIAGQARMMARDFQRSFDEIGRETELADLRQEIEALKRANPIEEIRGEVDKVALDAQNDQIRKMKLSKADPDVYAEQSKTIHASKPVAEKPTLDEAD
jgi:sec-independent protein translocase protein TatB